METQKLIDLTVDELYELADATEEAIKLVEEQQKALLNYHEELCLVIIKKEREEYERKS